MPTWDPFEVSLAFINSGTKKNQQTNKQKNKNKLQTNKKKPKKQHHQTPPPPTPTPRIIQLYLTKWMHWNWAKNKRHEMKG